MYLQSWFKAHQYSTPNMHSYRSKVPIIIPLERKSKYIQIFFIKADRNQNDARLILIFMPTKVTLFSLKINSCQRKYFVRFGGY